ncbi:transglycosylase SLT domain-containing protein [Enterovibrio sp. 27052020O]|uniref:transglycosylase SLT domain-containing protein n=1 Tax=Enterovibrio sp. 27052020O TaxID=3241166 RepID=UPI00388E85AF
MATNKIKTLAVCIAVVLNVVPALATADSFAELDREAKRVNQPQQEKFAEFYQWLDNHLSEYEAWRDEYTSNLDKERELLIDQWGSGEVSDSTKSVEYSDSNTVKKVVDYDNNTATISVLVDAGQDASAALTSLKVLDVDGQTVSLENASKDIAYVDYSFEQESIEKQFIIDQIQVQMRELDVQAERLIRSNTGIPESFIYERAHKKKIALLQSAAPRIASISEQFKAKRKELGIPEPVKMQPKKADDEKVVETAVIANKADVESTAKVEQVVSVESDETKANVMTDASKIINANANVEAKPPGVVAPKERAPKTEAMDTRKPSLTVEETPKKQAATELAEQSPISQPKPLPTTQPTTTVVSDVEPAKTVTVQASKPSNNTAKKVVSYKVKLPENALKTRASTYQPLVEKESERWEIDAALVMAIMHSESSFRPDAKSHVPAFGLMQVVPNSAGHDVNKLFRKIDSPMSPTDLYVPPINVETGTAYLNILDKRYLKFITNDQARLYCVIAAYNTGAGNVAKAFNKDRSTNIRKAAVVINSMTPDEVYDHLLENLPYDETKNYLRKVKGRISMYQ